MIATLPSNNFAATSSAFSVYPTVSNKVLSSLSLASI